MKLFASIEGLGQMVRNVEKVTADLNTGARIAIAKGAVAVHRDAVSSIQKNPRRGKPYVRYTEGQRREGVASAPGDAPASDTGRLATSVKIATDADGLGAYVYTDVKYGPWLEFGTRDQRIQARPWLGPAYDKNKGAINAAIREAYNKSVFHIKVK